MQFAKQFEGTHITDYFLSVNDQCSVFPTTTTTSYLDKYYQKVENGVEVDYTNDPFARGAYHIYDELESDFLGIITETLSDIGINPWLSFRMNDAHDMTAMEVGPLFTDFYHNHPEIRRVQHHSYVSYMDKLMDYTHPIVREYWLNYINETLNRYDIYGIELDFQRELYLWHIGGEYAGLDILNEFMRQVDDLVAVYEEKYGHKIKIATRVAYDVNTNFDFGLDVITWMAEGIVDMMIPASRFSSTDMDIPIRMWDSITESYGVELVASIEWTNIMSSYGVDPEPMDIETASAFAANAFSQGAEKVYLFNRYKSGTDFFTDSDKISTKSTYYTGNKALWNEYTTLGSYEKVLTMNRRNLLTYKDMNMLWNSKVSVLPKTVGEDTYTTFRVPMGDVLDGSELTLKFSVSESEVLENPPKVYINSVECTYLGLDICYSKKFTEDMLMCYEVPEEVHGDAYAVIEIMPETTFITEYVEIYIKAPN
ncbi:MAG: hypothetical protein IJY93_02980 [Clostridia bacterium]|nr:hypothetical protein [Clostridia bacterium]